MLDSFNLAGLLDQNCEKKTITMISSKSRKTALHVFVAFGSVIIVVAGCQTKVFSPCLVLWKRIRVRFAAPHDRIAPPSPKY